ncbi:MAG: tetratricopeptide repeat protein [Anaerolineae bacterium]|nr:tetratricopeptide repeat protein [Anaerolineae bacterium]
MTEHEQAIPLPDFTPALPGFRQDEFLSLTETLLAFPIEQDRAALDAAPFRIDRPEPQPEAPLPTLPPRWYPRPAVEVVEAARAALMPPSRPPIFEGRDDELENVLRPLLSGHPIRIHGEPGVGKTALLSTVATHERTRRRFRRIWWIDRPARLDQTLALALNLPHMLMEPDPAARRAHLVEQLDDATLLIVDNVAPADPALDELIAHSPHVLAAVDTTPELLDPDEPLPDDPEGVVTLRVLDDTPAIETLAFFASIEDTRRIRGDLLRIARSLGNHPFALMLAGKLVSRDRLSLDELEEHLELQPADRIGRTGDTADTDDEDADAARSTSLNRALDVSVEALPGDYRKLFEAFGAFPPDGALLDGLHATARIGNLLACRRGLIALADYGFVQVDHCAANRFIMHPVAYARAAAHDLHAPDQQPGKRMRVWALQYAKAHANEPLALYHAEACLLYACERASRQSELRERYPLFPALRPYLREYAPYTLDDEVTEDDLAEITGPRAGGVNMTGYGLDLTAQGAYFAAEEALSRALDLRQAHDSPHAVAETLVALGRLHDLKGDYAQAADELVRAAELVFKLGAEDSLSVIRRGLARVYRHLGRLSEALEVLDDAPEAHLERAIILRAQGKYDAAVTELDQAEDASPYVRAETLMLSGRYADALQAIADQEKEDAAHLRAQVYHLQGCLDEAIRGYCLALNCCDEDDPARAKIWRGLGASLASDGQVDAARDAFESALKLQQAQEAPDPVLLGRTLRLLAAVHLVAGDHQQAADTAREAIDHLKQGRAPGDTADAYRTLGRALWQAGDHAGALDAFTGEVEQAQSMPDRDEARIGIALHHLADAYQITGALDRAVANYRRALTHKDPAADPDGYMITQIALHRALIALNRLSAALDVSQEIVDHLSRQPAPDLQQIGYAQAIRARTQQAMQRPIRASQSMHEWLKLLASRADDAVRDPRPAVRVLVLGLAARSLLANERPALAITAAERGLHTAEEHFPGTPAAWAARRDLGEAYIALDRLDDAITALEPLLNEAVQADPATYALAHELTARAHRQLGNKEAALHHLQAALDHEPDTLRCGLIQETIGDVQIEIGQPSEAIESYQAALEHVPRDTHPDVAARILTTLAHTLGGLNRYAEAIGVYEDALSMLRIMPDVSVVHTSNVLRSLGQTHEAQGQLHEAAQVYRRALNVLGPDTSSRQSRDILHLLARVTAATGDQAAVQIYEQTRDETRQWGTEQELGAVLCELGDLHRDAGRLTPAIQNYRAALAYQTVSLFARDRANTLRCLGRAYAQMGRYDEARTAWAEALDISKDLPDQSPQEIALTHHAIGEAHRSQEQYTEAEQSYREALQHHSPGTVAAADTWRALGEVLHADGRPDDAVEPLQNALAAEKSQPQQANARLVQTLRSLAEVHEARGDLPNAIARYHETLVYMDRDLQAVTYADMLRTLGRLYGDNQQYDEAHTALNEALEIEMAYVPRSDERISVTLQAVADTYRAAGDLELAAEFYQKVTAYANLARRATQDLRETLDELDRRRATLQAAQQSLALFDRSDEADLKDLVFVYALLAKSHAALNQARESADTIRTLLDLLDERHDTLDAGHTTGDDRALALLAEANRARDADAIPAAQAACQVALESVGNANLRWVIEQFAQSLA